MNWNIHAAYLRGLATRGTNRTKEGLRGDYSLGGNNVSSGLYRLLPNVQISLRRKIKESKRITGVRRFHLNVTSPDHSISFYLLADFPNYFLPFVFLTRHHLYRRFFFTLGKHGRGFNGIGDPLADLPEYSEGKRTNNKGKTIDDFGRKWKNDRLRYIFIPRGQRRFHPFHSDIFFWRYIYACIYTQGAKRRKGNMKLGSEFGDTNGNFHFFSVVVKLREFSIQHNKS